MGRRILTKEGVFFWTNKRIEEYKYKRCKTFQEEFVSPAINYVKPVDEEVSYAGSTSLPSIEFDIVRKR